MKITTACVGALLAASTAVCYSQAGYIDDRPSFDCNQARNAVTRILCSGPEPAQADWDFNSAQWALYFTLNETRRQTLAQEQEAWRQSLDQICALPWQLTQEQQAGQVAGAVIGQIIIGPGFRIPGPQPLTQAHVNCVLNAYRARAASYGRKLVTA